MQLRILGGGCRWPQEGVTQHITGAFPGEGEGRHNAPLRAHTNRPGQFSFLFLPPPQVDGSFSMLYLADPSHRLTAFGDSLTHVPQVQKGYQMGSAQCMTLSTIPENASCP